MRIFKHSLCPELMEQGQFASGMPDIQDEEVTVPPLLIRDPLHP